MFCKYCGAPLDNDAAFCTGCGAGVGESSRPAAQPAPAAPSYNLAGPTPTKVMVFGIIGLALCGTGIPGIILSAIALRLANAFIRANGSVFGQAKVGRILGKVGLILGIVMTVFWAIYLIVVIATIAKMASHTPSFHYYHA